MNNQTHGKSIPEATLFLKELNSTFTVKYETTLNWQIILKSFRTPLPLEVGKISKRKKNYFFLPVIRNGNVISRCWKSNRRNLSFFKLFYSLGTTVLAETLNSTL